MTNYITNTLNAQEQTNYDPAALNLLKKEKTGQSRYIEAPSSLYKYSLHEKMLENDEFRKSVLKQKSASSVKKEGRIKKAVIAGVVVLAAVLLKSKKKS